MVTTAAITGDESLDLILNTPGSQNERRTSTNKKKYDGTIDAIGSIYASLVIGVSRNPSLKDALMNITNYGHAAVLAGEDLEMIPEFFETLRSLPDTLER